MLRIPFADLTATLTRALQALGLTPERAALSARLIAETDRDGVSTHGVARFPRFAEMVRLGRIDPLATPSCTTSLGALEQWDGHLGTGNLAAHAAMARAMELAQQHGLGGVALGNTTHWQRGGTFGWQAAEAGFGAICWSNTLPNLPPWGAVTPALGNNPLVIAIPNQPGTDSAAPIVLDMAMSQFSYGTLALHSQQGKPLPVPGGYDAAGQLTTDAAAIEASQRALPIGFWKGSGLSFVLDVLGAMLSGGKATHQIEADPLRETGQSQIFLAFSPASLAPAAHLAQAAVDALHAARPVTPGHPPRYPGEHVLALRRQNSQSGIPVPQSAWEEVVRLSAEPPH